MSTTIDVTAAGPIEGTFSIDLTKGPGAYEFRGARGTGKTTCISSIDWLSGHKVDVTLHDGAISGKIEGFGVVAPIGGRKRRKGDFELDTIDAEKFSLVDILDPQGKTPEVRDATRIKAIASLSEVEADPTLYYDLAGGQSAFDALGIAPSDDPVLLATRIKQCFDKIAREKQNTADAEAKHAEPLEHVPENLDIAASCDLVALGETRDHARDELQKFKDARETGLDKQRAAADATERLQAIRAEYSGTTFDEAQESLVNADKTCAAAEQLVEELERKLEKARSEAAVCQAEFSSAKAARDAAGAHQTAVEELRAISQQAIEFPGEDRIAAASTAVNVATDAYNQGVRIRDVKQNQEKAARHREAEQAAKKAADEAKNKAATVFDILAASLNTKHLEIKSVDGNPRLFVEHERRGTTAFDQVNGLSDGERVDFALRELLPHIESPGLLPIPQRVWQDLQPTDRNNLHALAVEKGLFLFGAQVDDGDLRVVFLGEDR